MKVHSTTDGDAVDEIAWLNYGVVNDAVLRAVLAANPGIAGAGALLPAGMQIVLPDISTEPLPSASVTLWS